MQENEQRFKEGALFIIIDGLDELPDELRAEGRLTAWLTGLPARCAVLLVSRPQLRQSVEADIVSLSVREGGLCTFRIDPASAENREVHRRYLQDFEFPLNEAQIEQAMSLGEGLFLLVHHFAVALALGVFGDARPERDLLYRELISDLHRRTGDYAFRLSHERLVAALLASHDRQPLSTTALLSHWRVPRDRLEATTRDLRFLVRTLRDLSGETSSRLMHETLYDALMKENRWQEAVGRAHAEYAEDVYHEVYGVEKGSGWAEVECIDDPAWTYAILHLPFHLRAARQSARAAEVEMDPVRRKVLRDTAAAFRRRADFQPAARLLAAAITSCEVARRRAPGSRRLIREEYVDLLTDYSDVAESLGQYENAYDASKKAARIARGLGDPAKEARCTMQAAEAAYLASRHHEAERLYARAYAQMVAARATEPDIAACRLGQAEVMFILDRTQEALQVCAELSLLPSVSNDAEFQAKVDHLRGRLLMETEQFNEALACYTRALRTARELGRRDLEADLLSFSSDTYLALGRIQEAQEAAELAYAAYSRFPDPMGCSEAAWSLGDIHAAIGRDQEAEKWYDVSILHAEQSRSEAVLLEPLVRLGKFLVQTGRADEARPHLERALAIATRLRERTMLQQIRKLMLGDRQKA